MPVPVSSQVLKDVWWIKVTVFYDGLQMVVELRKAIVQEKIGVWMDKADLSGDCLSVMGAPGPGRTLRPSSEWNFNGYGCSESLESRGNIELPVSYLEQCL
jgi:hypothetical protein